MRKGNGKSDGKPVESGVAEGGRREPWDWGGHMFLQGGDGTGGGEGGCQES